MQELNGKLIQWAKDREIDKYGTIEGQVKKTVEELAELIIGICKDDKEMIKDAIGDVYVTLVIGNMLDEKYLLNELSTFTEHSVSITGIKFNEYRVNTYAIETMKNIFVEQRYSVDILSFTLLILFEACKTYKLTLKECVESAYAEISNRKGKMVNGTFVKE